MSHFAERLVLERIGAPEATVGMVSLPLPRETAAALRIDHPASAMHGLAWWERGTLPRRALAFVIDDAGVPETLRVTTAPGAETAPAPSRWELSTRITREKLDYARPKFNDIASLRGVPTTDCTTVEFELQLSYGGRTLVLQPGATEQDGVTGPHYWQNVQIDRLWRNEVVEAVRVGGIIYNGDTYLWADLFLLLFANGVAHAALHFNTTKLHIEGYDFQGLPVVRLAGDVTPVQAQVPADGLQYDLGGVKLNLADAASLCSAEHPGTLQPAGNELYYQPFDRIFNPQLAESGPLEWAAGSGRTVRFQFSLSAAAPVVARYRVPSWWYTLAGEPWPGGFLPVRGRYNEAGELMTEEIRGKMIRGQFDAGSGEMANDGFAGSGMLRTYYLNGRPEVFADALDYCYFWTDWAVDHRDYTVHQWIGGWGWKTCAYTKFRDVLMGYLETGDPYLKDTVENCAEAYWMWFRQNWPRCTIGRDSFEVSGWAWLWRFFRTEHARDRTRELARMLRTVLETRGVIGGQMGGGPHPGYLSSLYMTGICMISLLETAEAEQEDGNTEQIQALLPLLHRAHVQFNRADVELFPSSYQPDKKDWHAYKGACWALLASRIYPEMIRLQGCEDEDTQLGLYRSVAENHSPDKIAQGNRPGDALLQSPFHDALVLGARATEDGVTLDPIGTPELWPPQWTVATPFGELAITVEGSTLQLSAQADFPVTITYAGKTVQARSNGTTALQEPVNS
ncbi:MAG: hypothetical protein ACYDCO_05895 [Armatimonadota bacterium]